MHCPKEGAWCTVEGCARKGQVEHASYWNTESRLNLFCSLWQRNKNKTHELWREKTEPLKVLWGLLKTSLQEAVTRKEVGLHMWKSSSDLSLEAWTPVSSAVLLFLLVINPRRLAVPSLQHLCLAACEQYRHSFVPWGWIGTEFSCSSLVQMMPSRALY